ncbi:MAG: DUF952 domain-containing protein [Caulobacteraceae bacterium]
MTRIYKILARDEWEAALVRGRFEGSAIDRADGFIHFSTAGQARETARRHFHGQDGLIVLAVEAESLGPALRWEASRGGALFPHLYSAPAAALAIEARPAPLGPDGVPDMGDLVP